MDNIFYAEEHITSPFRYSYIHIGGYQKAFSRDKVFAYLRTNFSDQSIQLLTAEKLIYTFEISTREKGIVSVEYIQNDLKIGNRTSYFIMAALTQD